MILNPGMLDYEEGLKLQQELVARRRLNEIEDSLLITEHPSVFTIGRSGSRDNLLADENSLKEKGIKVLDVDRGGDITFHGPGQLVVYPVIDLKNRKRDLHGYLRDLEEAAISFLKRYALRGERVKGATGVWVGDEKIAFIGVAAKDWVTYHGLSVNINVDINFFSMINPCGMKGVKVTSLKKALGRAVSMHEAKRALAAEFGKAFGAAEPLKKRITISEGFYRTRKAIADHAVNTVCESARCPNISECFSKKSATFMILGRNCTRACAFCSVKKDAPEPVDAEEPRRIADCVKSLDSKYVTVTSVTRDDLVDGGAGQFVKTVESIRRISKEIAIELLIPDFAGRPESIETIAASGADIIGHNIETVSRLYPFVRRNAGYRRSLGILKSIKDIRRGQLTKSAVLVGLGETEEEVIETMRDLRAAGCDMLVIGQYLRPSRENHPVERFVTPEEFERYKNTGETLGFMSVNAGPFARSSYYAKEIYEKCHSAAAG